MTLAGKTVESTREIDDARIDHGHYDDDEPWLCVDAAGDSWAAKWDREYGDGFTPDFMAYFGLTFDMDDVPELVGKEMPVKESEETGDWVAVDGDRIQGGGFDE